MKFKRTLNAMIGGLTLSVTSSVQGGPRNRTAHHEWAPNLSDCYDGSGTFAPD